MVLFRFKDSVDPGNDRPQMEVLVIERDIEEFYLPSVEFSTFLQHLFYSFFFFLPILQFFKPRFLHLPTYPLFHFFTCPSHLLTVNL